MNTIKYKCPVCYAVIQETQEDGITEIEINKDKDCVDCSSNLEVNAYYITEEEDIELEVMFQWNDENEVWTGEEDLSEGQTHFEDSAEIDQETYDDLSESEKEKYHVCDISGEIIEKYTGACRKDLDTGLLVCKSCRYYQYLG